MINRKLHYVYPLYVRITLYNLSKTFRIHLSYISHSSDVFVYVSIFRVQGGIRKMEIFLSVGSKWFIVP